MEIENNDYTKIISDIAEMKSDVKNLKEDKEILKSVLEAIQKMQVQNAVMIEQIGSLKLSQETLSSNLKCVDENVKQDISSVKTDVYNLKMQPLETYSKGKERFISGIVGALASAIVAGIIAYFKK